MTSTPTTPARRRSRGAIALLAVLAMLLVGLTVSTASAAVAKPVLKADPSSASALQVSWTAVSGAKSYRVQYATGSAFTGASVLPAAGRPVISDTSTTITGLKVNTSYYVRVSAVDAAGKVGTASAASVGIPRYPYAAPGDLFRTKVTKSSMTVTWAAVGGAPGYVVRAYAKGSPTKYFATATSSVNLTGLKAGTTYSLRAYAQKPGVAGALSANSPEVTQATSTYSLAAPDAFRQTAHSSSSSTLAWTAVAGAPAGSGYKVRIALDAALTDHDTTTGTINGTSTTIGGLKNDTTYFAKVFLVSKTGTQLSLLSDFIVANSLVPRGRITGQVAGVTGSDLTAAAYDSSGNVAKAVTVGSDNSYDLDLRPGAYRIQLQYTGTDNFATAWALAKTSGGLSYYQASPVVVARGKTSTAPTVTIRKGNVVTGTVLDRSGRPIRDVDVTAIARTAGHQEVLALSRSGSDGRFTIEGLGTSAYWFRFNYSGDGFRTYSSAQTVNRNLGLRITLANATFRSKYTASIKGTRKVGSTVYVHATPWLAGSYPTTQASMSFQWKRNGSAIRGATGSRYKLTGADRGATLTVTATARRYGYTTGVTTSKGKKVS